MEQINCYAFYDLGNILHDVYVRAIQPLQGWAYSVEKAKGILDEMVDGVGKFKLNESREAAKDLAAILAAFLKIAKDRAPNGRMPDPGYILEQPIVLQLNGAIYRFNQAFSLELGRAPTFFVTPKGVYDTQKLMSDASSMYEGYLDRLPREVIEDTNAAGRCLAFDLPTAAGFHVARATEAMMRGYMDAYGCPALKESQRNWGNFTKALTEAGANKIIVHHIDQIRELHRNPVTHPDVTLTRADAMSLQAMCQSVIQSMVADIEAKKPAPDPEIVQMLPQYLTTQDQHGTARIVAANMALRGGLSVADDAPLPRTPEKS